VFLRVMGFELDRLAKLGPALNRAYARISA
jgi:hypothetical protein